METQSKRNILRNLIIFTVIVITCGWIGLWVETQITDPSAKDLGKLIWLVAPLATSLILRAFAGDGWKDLGIKPAFKGNGKWWILSMLVMPVGIVLVLLLGYVFGTISFPGYAWDNIGIYLQAFGIALIPGLFKNIFEEFSWRGYLAPKINKLGLPGMVGHVIVGLIVASWHIPYIRYVTPYTTENLWTLIPRFVLALVAIAILYGELRILIPSVLPAWLMHTVGGNILTVFMVLYPIQFAKGLDFLFSPVIESIISIVFYAGVGMWIFTLRKKLTVTTK